MKMFYRSFFSIMKKYNNSERYGGMRHANGRYSFYVLLRFTRVADDPGISVILWRNGKKQKCAEHCDAQFLFYRHCFHRLGAVRIYTCLRTRQFNHWRTGVGRSERGRI